ncbi:hypothetical protein [Archangium primigenium]|uniref:hypothetical protein n=1 Tax=[Archangium] primigenium TaxID=2792470 RepID=UPI00195C7847|nr:hypothetical protein [Archangium primigenium]MBM7117730.1 hypothetical protein [Archangium primigenium]
MNVKTLTALVGSLSLGSLATGCATTKPAAAPMEQGTPAAMEQAAPMAPMEHGASAAPAQGAAAPAAEKAAEHGCGGGGCGSSGCGGKK